MTLKAPGPVSRGGLGYDLGLIRLGTNKSVGLPDPPRGREL